MTTTKRAAARVIDAWDSTVLPVANDGRLQEAMEDLRAVSEAAMATPTLREAAHQALEALAPLANATTPAEREALTDEDSQAADAASCDLRAALAEQAAEQAEPVAEVRNPQFGGSSYEASMLRELLARIHGDGGHYVAKHGLDKALEDADRLVAEWRAAPPAPARQEPLFLLHTGQIDSEGEQDEWDIEANSWVSVEEFCLANPGQTIGLHPQPLPAAPITAAPAEGEKQ